MGISSQNFFPQNYLININCTLTICRTQNLALAVSRYITGFAEPVVKSTGRREKETFFCQQFSFPGSYLNWIKQQLSIIGGLRPYEAYHLKCILCHAGHSSVVGVMYIYSPSFFGKFVHFFAQKSYFRLLFPLSSPVPGT